MSALGPHSLDEIQERAALYAVGALDGDEAREFESHIEAGCEVCRRERDAFRQVGDEVSHAANAITPPPALRDKVLRRVAGPDVLATTPVFEDRGSRFVRPADLPWRQFDPEVQVKRLTVDRQNGRLTQLIRMAPGSRLKPHRHADDEESFVLEGSLMVGGVRMRAGDYCRAEAESRHDDVWSEEGCTFIAVTSLRDEYQA